MTTPCRGTDVSRSSLLIGHELALHSEVLAGTIRALRPSIEAQAVPQGDLDRTVADLRPRLVICSVLTDLIKGCAQAWILLSLEAGNSALASVAGTERAITEAGFDDVISIVDEVWNLP